MGCNSKEEYDFFKELHICIRCKKESAEPNKVMCWECNERDKKYDKQKRERHIEEYRKKDKEKYQILKENGICTYCKKRKAAQGKLKCEKCLSILKNRKDNKRTDIPRNERISYGLCYTCGKNELMDGKGVCAKCYEIRLKSISKIMHLQTNEQWKKDNSMLFKNKIKK